MTPYRPKLNFMLSGNGVPVVLIHGVGATAQDWQGVVLEMGAGFHILRYDLRGHGASEAPPGPYRITDFAEDLAALMDVAGFAHAHIAGFSLGGLVAQAFALSYPERVHRLALLSTVAGRTAEERERVVARLDFIAKSHPADYFAQSVARWFTPAFRDANPEVVAGRKAAVSAMDQNAYAAAYHALAHTDFGDRLHTIKAETLVMTGSEDIGSNPRMAHFMAETIPQAQLEIVPGLRHSILLEAPALVGAALRKFFSVAPDHHPPSHKE